MAYFAAGTDVKFGFVAKHRGIWRAGWLGGAMGVWRGGFYAWFAGTISLPERCRSDEELGAKVRASFLASDRTYGAGGCGALLLAFAGKSWGLHRIDDDAACSGSQSRSPRRAFDSRLIWVSGRSPPSLPTYSTAASKRLLPTANGSLTSPMCGRQRAGSMWPPWSICSRGAWSAGR